MHDVVKTKNGDTNHEVAVCRLLSFSQEGSSMSTMRGSSASVSRPPGAAPVYFTGNGGRESRKRRMAFADTVLPEESKLQAKLNTAMTINY
eukprot:scaffold664220_cov31-Prasinocladus_malaysianus.AAC.1